MQSIYLPLDTSDFETENEATNEKMSEIHNKLQEGSCVPGIGCMHVDSLDRLVTKELFLVVFQGTPKDAKACYFWCTLLLVYHEGAIH